MLRHNISIHGDRTTARRQERAERGISARAMRPERSHVEADIIHSVILNIHERWLLRSVGLNGSRRRELVAALRADGQTGGDVDVVAQAPGFTLAKSTVKNDLPGWFDRLMTAPPPKAGRVVYGHRRYRRTVILACALSQAGVDAAAYRTARARGARSLDQFQQATTKPH